MPAKNTVKTYVANSYYHLYNRGVEKRLIFQDQQDYNVFLNYLKEYLLPKDIDFLESTIASPSSHWKEKDKAFRLLKLNNFSKEINLVAYCLMPNHFHLLIKQSEATAIDRFVQSLCTRYTMYFNRKNKRVGSLFQAVYKAVLIKTDEQLLQLTRYIHRQGLDFSDPASRGETSRSWIVKQPCSFSEYIELRNTEWVKPQEILAYFIESNQALSYDNFVLEKDEQEVSDIIIE